MNPRLQPTEITDNLAELLHADARGHLADPDGVLESAANRVAKACAAMRALADLTGGQSRETTESYLAEVKREDMGALIGVIEEHLQGSLMALDGVARDRLARKSH